MPEGVTASPSSSFSRSPYPHPRSDKLKQAMNPAWLRAHDNRVSPKNCPQELISISDSPRPLNEIEDLGSVYRAEEVDDIDKLNDLFTYFNEDVAGPSRVGPGRGKDIRMFPGIRDHLYDLEPEGKDDAEMNEASS